MKGRGASSDRPGESAVGRIAPRRKAFGPLRSAPSDAIPLALAIGILTLLWFPTLAVPFGRDQGLWAAIADQINRGGTLYVDGITTKPPGVIYLYTWTLALWRDMQAIRVLDLVWSGGTLVFMSLLVPRERRWVVTPLLGLLLGLSQFWAFTFWVMAGPDVFIALPVLAAVWLQTTPLALRPGQRRFAIGCLFAVAFWFKYTAIVFVLLVPLLDIWGSTALRPRKLSVLVEGWLLSGLGFCFVCGLVLLHAALQGGLGAFREVQIDYLMGYSGFESTDVEGVTRSKDAGVVWVVKRTRIFAHYFSFVLIPAALALPCFKVGREPHVVRMWLAALFACLSVGVQQWFFFSHYAPLVPWLCLLSGMGIGTVVERGLSRLRLPDRLKPLVAIPVSLAVVAVLFSLAKPYEGQKLLYGRWKAQRTGDVDARFQYLSSFGSYGSGDFSYLADLEVARYVRSNTRPDDRIFVWGFEPLIYFASNRRPVSRFMSATTIVNTAADPSWKEELQGALRATPPELFIVVSQDDLGWLTGRTGDSRGLLRRLLPELLSWLRENYQIETRIEHFTVWRNKASQRRARGA